MSVTHRTFAVRSGRDLSRAVREARISSSLTQEQLARQAGLDRTYLAKMETGLTVVLLDRIVRTLRLLGAEVVVTVPVRRDGA
jgi:transcriptional regulator with XRE-family HTH domain